VRRQPKTVPAGPSHLVVQALPQPLRQLSCEVFVNARARGEGLQGDRQRLCRTEAHTAVGCLQLAVQLPKQHFGERLSTRASRRKGGKGAQETDTALDVRRFLQGAGKQVGVCWSTLQKGRVRCGQVNSFIQLPPPRV
jgi:hypothetical protein